MATRENIQTAFAGESQANRKYRAFSEKAGEDGLKNTARLLLAISEAEAIHARRLLDLLGEVGPTAHNLEASIQGETHEYTAMYPGFLKEAEAEKNTQAAQVFTYAMKAEEGHAGLYKQALEAVQDGHDLATGKVYLCPVCGYIAFGKPPFKCPTCSMFGKQFREIIL